MEAESLKLGLIERLMKLQNTSVLQRLDQLITQAEMESRAEESLDSIAKGETISLEKFGEENKAWAKKKHTK